MSNISIAIHGGAGTLLRSMMTPEKERLYLNALREARDAGFSILEKGGSALDAVEEAVRHLEDCPLFNAGRGSVFTNSGTHEMDASIMEGAERRAGAVSLVRNIKNPISLARMVMERSEHVFMAGEGAMEFARLQKAEMADDLYFFDTYRHQQWQQAQSSGAIQLDHTPLDEKKFGTVGAVALDAQGNLAAATSTGGMTNKRFGRVGDSPMIGAGTYANNRTCAVSCTGSGEYFIRGVVAYDVSSMMEFGGKSLQEACETVVKKRLLELGGDGGLIAVNATGEIVMSFNTEGMYRAARSSSGVDEVSIYA
jgi:beta-aspartyl-peptidase (threonine type)